MHRYVVVNQMNSISKYRTMMVKRIVFQKNITNTTNIPLQWKPMMMLNRINQIPTDTTNDMIIFRHTSGIIYTKTHPQFIIYSMKIHIAFDTVSITIFCNEK